MGVLRSNSQDRLKTQVWFCEKCETRGTVYYREGAGVWEVVDIIGMDHHHQSPECKNPTTNIQVVNHDYQGG